MSRTIETKELNAINLLEASKRYSYFVKQVADSEILWSLKNASGWVLMGDDQGNELVPIWPHEKFSTSCAIGQWADTTPSPIELPRWIDNWLPGMLRDGRQAAVFPTPNDKGMIVSPLQLRSDLEEELLKYE